MNDMPTIVPFVKNNSDAEKIATTARELMERQEAHAKIEKAIDKDDAAMEEELGRLVACGKLKNWTSYITKHGVLTIHSAYRDGRLHVMLTKLG